MSLIHCVYCSALGTGLDGKNVLDDILAVSRRNNPTLGITGVLLYERGSFFQVLEGEQATIETLYERIASDPRHRRIFKIIQEPIPSRAFSEWSMAYASLEAWELDQAFGLNDFFTGGNSFESLENGRVRTLLDEFREGRWHSRLY